MYMNVIHVDVTSCTYLPHTSSNNDRMFPGENCTDFVDFCVPDPCPQTADCASEPLVGPNCTCKTGYYGDITHNSALKIVDSITITAVTDSTEDRVIFSNCWRQHFSTGKHAVLSGCMQVHSASGSTPATPRPVKTTATVSTWTTRSRANAWVDITVCLQFSTFRCQKYYENNCDVKRTLGKTLVTKMITKTTISIFLYM